MERQFAKLLDEAHIIGWEHNYPVTVFGTTYYIDFAWPKLYLGIETDSHKYHSSPFRKKKDRRKQARLETHGWVIVRFTTTHVVTEPEWVKKNVMQTLGFLNSKSLTEYPSKKSSSRQG